MFLFTLVTLAVEQSEGVFFGQKAVVKCLISVTENIDPNKSCRLTQIHMEHFRRNYLSGKFLQQTPKSSFGSSLTDKNLFDLWPNILLFAEILFSLTLLTKR